MIEAVDDFAPDGDEVVRAFLEAVDRVPAADFTRLGGLDELDDGAAVERDSRAFCARFLRPEASPWNDALEVKRYAHRSSGPTIDLLWHAYASADDELDLGVIEGAKQLLVRVHPRTLPLLGATDEATAENVDAIAELVLTTAGQYDDPFGQSLPYDWELQYRPPIRDGSRFSSAPAEDPYGLSSWATRLDAGIHVGSLFFLLHKVRVSGDGRIVSLDDRGWFDGSCWEPYGVIQR